MKIAHPKVFISYCWTSDEYQKKVENLAKQLLARGIDVVLDLWELKLGNDLYTFMERSVNDPDISNVLIVINPEYAKKANEYKGGVGTETCIISPEVYCQAEQEKFIPVVLEKQDGKTVLPTYLKRRWYSDLSEAGTYDEKLKELVSALYGEPLHKKPSLGTLPDWMQEDNAELFNSQKDKSAGSADDISESNKSGILVIGIGKTGEGILLGIKERHFEGVELAYIDSDRELLDVSSIEKKLFISRSTEYDDFYGGLDQPDRPLIWPEEFENLFNDIDLVIVAFNWFGNEDRALARLIAKTAKERKILTIGSVMCPSINKRAAVRGGDRGLFERLQRSFDSYIYVSAYDIMAQFDIRISGKKPEDIAKEVLCKRTVAFVNTVMDLRETDSLIDIDFADLTTVLSHGGHIYADVVYADSLESCVKKLNKELEIYGGNRCRSVILALRGDESLSLDYSTNVIDMFREAFCDDFSDIIFGCAFVEDGKDYISVLTTWGNLS